MTQPGNAFATHLRDPSSFTVALSLTSHFDTEPVHNAGLADGVQAWFISGSRAVEGGPTPPELAAMVLDGGGEPVVTVPLADRNRERVLSDLREYHGMGVRNLLLVTGDYPRGEEEGRVPFFDIDSVQLLMLLREAHGGDTGIFRDFIRGVVVSPFKKLEEELLWQYAKLERKVQVGADFIVSQAGFEPRAWDEVVRFVRNTGLDRPVMGNVLVPDLATARRIADGQVPGLSVPPALLEKIADEERRGAEGRRETLRRAAKSMAVMRGLGCDGALLGGRLSGDDVGFVLEEAQRLSPRWKECLEETTFAGKRYTFFQPGAGGLNSDEPRPVPPKERPGLMYLFSYFVDYVAFGSWKPFFRLLTEISFFCDRRPFWYRVLWLVEYASKRPPYGCRMCGDCTLYACGFLCYESWCPKRMLNGPCGGSVDGFCEVRPGKKKCFWVRVYEELKGTTDRPGFVSDPIPPRNRRLDGTCSWINFCLRRDHRKFRW
jgi:methylenetetrahydrofolate reductase (NADPH)